MSWYVSRALPIDADTYFVIEGEDPWNAHALDDGLIGDHARWWLKLQLKHAKVPWWGNILDWPRVTRTRLIHVTPVDRLLGLALAWWITWRLARP